MTSYEEKKAQFDGMMTLYGRKPVIEVLSDDTVDVFRLHIADSNATGGIMQEIRTLADKRGIEAVTHTREALSRISKNRRQDQGVAIDIRPARYRSVSELGEGAQTLIGLDSITNPQNLGMIMRSVAASPLDGLILPRKGCARIDALVHKASAGTLFHSDIYHCQTLQQGLKKLANAGFEIVGLTGDADESLETAVFSGERSRVFLLGNESTGLSPEISQLCDRTVSIPMANQVESINVAAAATLVAFRSIFSA